YADLPADPDFAFGQGGSYARFDYRNLRFDPVTFTLQIEVENKSPMAGVETVQVYIHDCVASVMRPVKQLVAFQRVGLAAGEAKTVSIAVDPNELALITQDEKRVIEPGEFKLMVGHSSRDEDLLAVTFQYGD
ncbi:MAG: fibronectin type III-like domain-contianing protein, partial [Eubacteriales bacterium]|nr:fibronectin type III-like domain-contianing protein [Eubacteriales bacterium]